MATQHDLDDIYQQLYELLAIARATTGATSPTGPPSPGPTPPTPPNPPTPAESWALKRLKEEKALNEMAGRNVSLLNRQIELQTNLDQAATDADRRQIQLKQELLKTTDSYVTSLGKSIGLNKQATTGFGKMTESLLGVANANKEVSGGIRGTLGVFADLGKSISSSARGFLNWQSILLSALEASINFAFEQDKQIVAFNRATGVAGTFNSELGELTVALIGFGISAEDQVKSFQALYTSTGKFSELLPKTRKEIVDTTSLLGKMGFAIEKQAKNILFLEKSFGQSSEVGARFNTRLLSLSRNLSGIPIKMIESDFQEAQKVLGASSTTVEELARQFGKLEKLQEQTRLSMSTMLSVAGKFDTFTSAATQVGRLNALLGGPFLSTIEMVSTTDPAERLKLLIDGVQRAGKSFDTMAYYEKKAIAEGMGFSDVNDVALALSGNMALIEPPQMDAQSIIEMKKQMKDFNTVLDEFKNIGMSMVVSFEPMIPLLKEIAANIKPVISALQFMMYPIAAFLGAMNDLTQKGWGLAAVLMAIFAAVAAVAIASTFGAAALPIALGIAGIGMWATGFGMTGVKGAEADYTGKSLPGNDVISTAPGGSGYGKRTLLGPEGAISLNNKDTIIAGTNLVGSSPAASGMAGRFNEATARSQNTIAQQTTAPATGGNVNIYLSIDGEEIRTVVNKVKIDPALSPNLYNSIASLITRGEETR